MSRLLMGCSAVAEPFWLATREKKLVLQWCKDCRRSIFYPRKFCPKCFGTSIEWHSSPGNGVVYAVSTMHKPGNPAMTARVPYTVALVDLAEGVRLLTNIVGCMPGDVQVGAAVTVDWEALPDGRHLPVFKL